MKHSTYEFLNLNVLLSAGDNAFSHKKPIVFKEVSIFLRIFFALVQEEPNDSLLQHILQFSEEQKKSK